jgi:hypothetical protein
LRAVFVTAVLATVLRLVACLLRGLARPDVRALLPARCACGPTNVGSITGAIGSANTDRIDKNVEHTKNAPANKKTVLTAFFNEFATVLAFIDILPVFWGNAQNSNLSAYCFDTIYLLIYLIISIFGRSVNNK